MTTTKHKITAFLLLIPVLMPVIFSCAFHIQQQWIQHKMKRRLESDLLHSLTINKKNIRWSRPGKELMVNGHYFDVKKINDNKDGSISVKGIYDDEETLLLQRLKEATQRSRNNHHKIFTQLLQFVSGLDDTQYAERSFTTIAALQYPCFAEMIPPPAFTGNHTPPPRG
ncbi:MAG TPA: hypothetical protein PKZ71_03095 [Chitinophagaceae bacterium]|nr:hypothetical protein [Chitinophagaceae bacterium]HNA91213.1 hypothetical protein [Chitinophagaceae bacterium]HNA96171.1 hypothetical protein [Chitinophagaceae bacterium]HNC39746.1 hypothetical protein [Chitinophagaceae bacterium]HNF37327.1 hypothetical protein [Chitinophagaceae bacterium]